MRWLILGCILILAAAAAFFHSSRSSSLREPQIVDDGIKSDPECFDLLARFARRETAVFDAIERGRKPVGLKCSNTEIARSLRSEGAILRSVREDGALNFVIRSKERWLFGKRSNFGSKQYDRIFIARDEHGAIRVIWMDRPYIT